MFFNPILGQHQNQASTRALADLVQLIMTDAPLLAVLKLVIYLDWRVNAICSLNTDRECMHSSSGRTGNMHDLQNCQICD